MLACQHTPIDGNGIIRAIKREERLRPMERKKIAFFDTKPYDRESFDRLNGGRYEIKYFETRLTAAALPLAEGCDAACAFVNAEIDRAVVEGLVARGIKVLAMRCAGYNNVDFKAAYDAGLTVVRVPAYSPYAASHPSARGRAAAVSRVSKYLISYRPSFSRSNDSRSYGFVSKNAIFFISIGINLSSLLTAHIIPFSLAEICWLGNIQAILLFVLTVPVLTFDAATQY